MGIKSVVSDSMKKILGDIPYSVELYWTLVSKNKAWSAHYQLEDLRNHIQVSVNQVKAFKSTNRAGKKIFIFAALHYWIDYTCMVALALVGRGNNVTMSFMPYAEWDKSISNFDLRKQSLYTYQVLEPVKEVLQVLSLLDIKTNTSSAKDEIREIAKQVSDYDTQYTLQVEEVDEQNPLFHLRYQRNLYTAQALYTYLSENKPDVLVVPNGTIQEMGVAYRIARLLNIEVVTFEFGDQAERIWLAQNDEIMRHDTSKMWAGLSNRPLTEENQNRLNQMFSARKNAELWGKLTRRWQKEPSKGTSKIRETLGLDDRPIVIIATNVLGDSLTLGRQVFSTTMAEWLEKTVQFFSQKSDVQLIIRIHPGEVLTSGTSMADIAKNAVDKLPEHIHLIGPREKINTYDVVAIADLGLVYTTTVGLEMAMSGLPVVVAGKAHYRERGFTHDPVSYPDYFSILEKILINPSKFRLNDEQLELAYRYAYLFFFEYPLPFPWHVLSAAQDYAQRDLAFVLSNEGEALYGDTFRYLSGENLDWSKRNLGEGIQK